MIPVGSVNRQIDDGLPSAIGGFDPIPESKVSPHYDVNQAITDDFGDVRVRRVRRLLDYDSPSDQRTMIGSYAKWVGHNEYAVIQLETENPALNDGAGISTKTVVVKCSKRGNDVSTRQLKRKVSVVENALRVIGFPGRSSTRLVYVTLTYDIKRCSPSESWKNVGHEWNAFLSGIKNEYGKVLILRSWEAFENGYPHIHAILYFPNFQFRWFDVNKVSRIQTKHKTKISNLWHSFVDIQAITESNRENCIHDVLQYVTKQGETNYLNISEWSKKELLTVSAPWFFGLRSIGVSMKGFQKILDDYNRAGGKTDLTVLPKVIQNQVNLDGEILTVRRATFLGIIGENQLRGMKIGSVTVLEDPPDWLIDVWLPARIRESSGGIFGWASNLS